MANLLLKSKPTTYLIGKPRIIAADLEEVPFDLLKNEMANRDINLLEELGLPNQLSTLVVEATDEKIEQLMSEFDGRLIVERNELLDTFEPGLPDQTLEMEWNSGFVTLEDKFIAEITVKENGTGNKAVANAVVYLLGSLWSGKGITDKKGKVTIELYGETKDTIKAIYVKPQNTYWSLWLDNPDVKPSPQGNRILLNKLSESSTPNFPEQESFMWGHRAMKLDQIPADNHQGEGVKIAIIDSGLYTDHSDLDGNNGQDYTNGNNWENDIRGHGSHVAGVIAGFHNIKGIKGFAPKATLHVFKIFPGGKFSDLIKSINQCVENEIDVVNLSLGSTNSSELLQQAIQDAKEKGVACVAAAGNAAASVRYPAAFSEVLAVAAIGKTNTFPEDSYHNRQVGEHRSSDNEKQYFSARFTCFGSEVDVCAPGVAVTSSVPDFPEAYASWDGTSMACPHVVGLAALIIEARDEIKSKPRGSERVNELFKIIKEASDDLGLPAEYQGAGMPNTLKALNETSGNNGSSGGENDAFKKLEALLLEAISCLKSLPSK